jgi:LmbE family N-acetylglucosaminyl deacetylase
MLKGSHTGIVSADEITSLDIYRVMERQADGLLDLKKAISDSDDSSLFGQLKLLRIDITDNQKIVNKHLVMMAESVTSLNTVAAKQAEEFIGFQDRLWLKLQDFADMLSKSATEQVIEALKTVIQDFNNNLVEQFGENFKQLNAAVLKLVEWQENYKGQLADMKDQYDLGLQSLSATEASVSNISDKAQAIPVTMTALEQVMQVNQHQIEELGRHLDAFKDIRDRAVEAVPEIREQIDQTIAGAAAANESLAKGMQESAERMHAVLMEGTDNFKESVTQTSIALSESAQTTASVSEQIKDQFSGALEDINNHMRNLVAELQEGGKAVGDSYKEASTTLLAESKATNTAFTSSMEKQRVALEKSITDSSDAHLRQAEKLTAGLHDSISESVRKHQIEADKVIAGLEQGIQSSMSGTAEAVKKQIEMIDKAAEQETQKVLKSMAGALTTISGQFTTDYQSLVKSMGEIVKTRH